MADSQLQNAKLFESDTSEKSFSGSNRSKRTLADFIPVEKSTSNGAKSSELGKGAFGAVRLVKDSTSGKLYAMKIVAVVHTDQEGRAEREKPD